MVTTRDLLYMSNTKMTLNCRNISGILQVLTKFQPSNGALSEKYTETDFCLTEKYFILNNLGDNNLLNKKSEFINKCRHQRKLLLSSVLCEDSMD